MKFDIIGIVKAILGLASPELRKAIVDYIDALDEHAKSTDNPWDDLFVSLLRVILGG